MTTQKLRRFLAPIMDAGTPMVVPQKNPEIQLAQIQPHPSFGCARRGAVLLIRKSVITQIALSYLLRNFASTITSLCTHHRQQAWKRIRMERFIKVCLPRSSFKLRFLSTLGTCSERTDFLVSKGPAATWHLLFCPPHPASAAEIHRRASQNKR